MLFRIRMSAANKRHHAYFDHLKDGKHRCALHELPSAFA